MMTRLESCINGFCRNPEELPVMLSIREAAQFARVSEISVRKSVLSGELRAKKVGRIYRIPKTELLRWAGIQE